MHYLPRLPQPSRTLAVPLAAALGAGVATAAFAVVNIDHEANVSLPAVQSALPSGAPAGGRTDGGPAVGTAQQIMSPSNDLRSAA